MGEKSKTDEEIEIEKQQKSKSFVGSFVNGKSIGGESKEDHY